MNAKKWNKSISAKKDTGERFSTKSKSTCKNSGTFEGKSFYPKKYLTSVHQAIQFEKRQQMIYFSCFYHSSLPNCILNSKKWIVLLLDLVKQG